MPEMLSADSSLLAHSCRGGGQRKDCDKVGAPGGRRGTGAGLNWGWWERGRSSER